MTWASARPWIIWLGGALFFYFQAIMRSVPNAIAGPLCESFHVSPRDLALLGSYFYGAYALMQMPVGILTDYFGPKRVLILGSLGFSAGIFVFTFAESLQLASVGRIIMGLAGATAFISTLRLAATLFDARQFAMLVGVTMTLGKIGGVSVNLFPWATCAASGFTWRVLLQGLALITAGLSFAFLIFLKDTPRNPLKENPSHRPSCTPSKAVFKERALWATGLYAFFFYTFITTFADIFSNAVLKLVYPELHPNALGSATSLLFAGMCVGASLISWLSNRYKTRLFFLRYGALAQCIMMTTWVANLPHVAFGITQFVFLLGGIIVGAQALVFTTASELVSKESSATATGIVNTLSMLGGFAVPLGLKFLMDAVFGSGTVVTIPEFQLSLALLCAGYGLAFLISFAIPESFGRKKG